MTESHDLIDGFETVDGFPDHEVLLPDESNFESVIRKLTELHEHANSASHPRPGRRALGGRFRYADEVDRVPFPLDPQPWETAMRHSIEAFEGSLRWHHPHALFNINPSPLLDTVALTALAALYNPNASWDITSGKMNLVERRVVSFVARLAGWGDGHGGVFTSGGKATLTYAVKSGINRCDPGAVTSGLRRRYAVLASANAHFSLESVCNLLGIGRDALHRIDVGPDGTVDVAALRTCLRKVIADGNLVACVVLSGGGTINLAIDPVAEARKVIDEAARDNGLGYVPHLHLDSVISWAWLSFLRDRTSLDADGLAAAVQSRVLAACDALAQVTEADSFAADFHKTGLVPYGSSCYITKNASELMTINQAVGEGFADEMQFGESCSYARTFENSRSCTGIISAYHMLHRLGIRGLQSYLLRLLTISESLRKVIAERHAEAFEVLNNRSLGFEVVFRILGPGEPDDTDPRATRERADALRDWLTFSEYCDSRPVPFVGYVPQYRDGTLRSPVPAFLLYPNSVHLDDEEIVIMLDALREAVRQFDADHQPAGDAASDGPRPLPPR